MFKNSVLVLNVLFAGLIYSSKSKAERIPSLNSFAVASWNSLKTTQNLEAYLTTGKSKAEQAAIKAHLSAYAMNLPKAKIVGDSIQFGNEATKWSMDSSGGIWVNNDLFLSKATSYSKQLQELRAWLKAHKKVSRFSVWVAVAQAQVVPKTPDEIAGAFLQSFGATLQSDCLMSSAPPVKAGRPMAIPKGKHSIGFQCPSADGAKEVVFNYDIDSKNLMRIVGDLQTSASTKRNFAKTIRLEFLGETRIQLNMIESRSARGSDVHMVEFQNDKGTMDKFSRAEMAANPAAACLSETSHRMTMLINYVCSNEEAAKIAQEQLSGKTPSARPAVDGDSAGQAK